MNHSLDNDISALMDDELPPDARDELYQALKSDTELVGKWARYHVIRDALTNQLPEHLHLDLADRVREAIDSEPTHFLPQKRSTPPAAKPAESESEAPVARPAWFMPAAAAATVAAVAILGFQLDRGPGEGMTMAERAAPSGPSPSAPVALVSQRGQEMPPPQWLRGTPTVAASASPVLVNEHRPFTGSDGERYLVEHSGVAAGGSVNTVFPYARMVSQDMAGVR